MRDCRLNRSKLKLIHLLGYDYYEGNPQFIIKIVYSCVVDIKIITPKYFRLLFFRHHQRRMIVKKFKKKNKNSDIRELIRCSNQSLSYIKFFSLPENLFMHL